MRKLLLLLIVVALGDVGNQIVTNPTQAPPGAGFPGLGDGGGGAHRKLED